MGQVMKRFDSDGVEIAYLDEGEGEPVVLVHGFASTAAVNWVNTSWVGTLTGAGRRVLALDNRGHGASGKPHDPALYAAALMAGDVARLLAREGLARADVVGYSMGARVTATLALARPDLARSIVLGGLGIHLVDGAGLPPGIADAMEAPGVESLADPTQRLFRRFAEANGGDLAALAACIRGSRQAITAEQVGAIACPALVAVGTRDPIGGPAGPLAALLPKGRALDIPDRDHNLAVGDKVFKRGVLGFLDARP